MFKLARKIAKDIIKFFKGVFSKKQSDETPPDDFYPLF